MEEETMDLALPPTPRGLCFDRLDFVKTNFSVDNFLSEHENVAPLETIRDDLGVYLKVLRLAMIELINKDYANFVNLSATLIGFDESIDKIQSPLVHLNEEVLSVKQCIEDAMKELTMWLNQRHTLQKKKNLLKYYSQTMKCLSTLENILDNISEKDKHKKLILADRAVMEYNQLKFSILKCESLIRKDQKLKYENIGKTLIQTLNELLFQFWNDNDEQKLIKTLVTLAALDMVNETEILIRKQAISPLLQEIINETALQKTKDGLKGIYNRVISLLDTKLKLLHSVTKHSKLVYFAKRYQFLVNCFWCEVESRLEVNLASIFAPGNPRIFYERYNESMEFIRKLESYCDEKEMVTLLHSTPEFKSFQKRWNLPVYFQIRFQEIAGLFEATLLSNPTLDTSNNGFVLKETFNCWKALESCWSEGVYIEALAHKFWKLTLQLVVRYATWCNMLCNQKKSSPKLEPNNVNKELVKNSINLYLDSQILLKKLPQLMQHIEAKIPIKNKHILRQSMKPSSDALQGTKNVLKKGIVDELYGNFNSHLKQVSDIPRLYRKTNRSVPSKPCTYIETVTKGMQEFKEDFTQRVDNAFLIELFEDLFNVLTVSYCKHVEDVITSVQKTEESLRRLKQIRDKTSPQNSENAGITDGDKIRLQLKVDALAYEKLAKDMQVDRNCIEKFKQLNTMITDAVKNIDIK